ncbi:MAG: NAD(P)-binding domain-containing protein [Solirubrobacteraceae bacterium]
MSDATTDIRAVGFIGLGDQGLAMATAIAEAGYELHVWARRPQSLQALRDTPHVAHNTVGVYREFIRKPGVSPRRGSVPGRLSAYGRRR